MSATVNQVVGLLRGFLAGEEDARKLLSEVCEDEGDTETAELLRGKGVQWFSFNEEQAKGKVGVSRGVYGPTIHLGHCELPDMPQGDGVGYVDLYGASGSGVDDDGKPGTPVSLIFFDPRIDEVAVRLVYNEQGHLEVIVNRYMDQSVGDHPQGIFEGDAVFRFGAELTQEGP
jgi:hypothetical protein